MEIGGGRLRVGWLVWGFRAKRVSLLLFTALDTSFNLGKCNETEPD